MSNQIQTHDVVEGNSLAETEGLPAGIVVGWARKGADAETVT